MWPARTRSVIMIHAIDKVVDIYIYIYMSVCVCVCVCMWDSASLLASLWRDLYVYII